MHLSPKPALLLASLVLVQSAEAQTNFCRAILTKQAIVLSGGVVIDSFNSLDPAQSTNGRYDPVKRQDGGDIGSITDSVRAITENGSGKVYGHVATGPSGTVITTGNASIGSLTWVEGGNRGVQPGWYTNSLSAAIPDVQLPAVTFVTMPTTGGTVNGISYTYVLNSGNYRRSANFNLSGSQKMAIHGKVVLYLSGDFQISGSAYVYITPGSSLTLYLGGDAQLSGGGIVNGTGFATNCTYFGLPTCESIDNGGSSDFIGTIYAPQADVRLSGGGSATFHFAGAVVANAVNVNGNYEFHFDESLCGPINRPPIANNDSYAMQANTLLTINAPGVLANDNDPDGNPLGAILASNPGHGILTFNTNGSFSYRPDTNYVGMDSFTYRAKDATATSGIATVTITIIAAPIVVIDPPRNQTNCPGSTATFSVTATGTAITYQWFFGTNALPGQTNSTFALANVSSFDAGTYCVVISGAGAGSVTNCALLVVNQNTIVTVPPANQVACPYADVIFHVTATGTALNYQWYHASTLLGGQTGPTLQLNNVTSLNAGLYTVIVSGACGPPVTNSAMLTVNQTVAITARPINQIGFVGSNVTFSVGATGTALTYSWFFNGTIVGTNSTLLLNNLTTNQTGTYCVVVSGACGSPLTNCATLHFQNRRPIANNDSYTTLEDTVLTTNAPGVLLNDSDPDGDSLTVILFAPPMHGTVTLNPSGSFTYRPFTNYNGPDSFAYHANDSKTNSNLGIVNISVVPMGDGPIARDDAYSTPSDTALVVTLPGVLANDTDPENDPLSAALANNPSHGSLTLHANGSFTYIPETNYHGLDAFTYKATDGSATSGVATVTITVVPSHVMVVTPPANQTICPGGTATFTVTATGTALTYQWLFGTNILANQTNSTLVLTNVAASSAGTYCVIVSGAAGNPVTNCALLIVNQNVILTAPLTNQEACPGATAVFNVAATGTALTYQWYRGLSRTVLIGETNSALVLTNVTLSSSDLYAVVVSGACGTPMTNSAQLFVHLNVAVGAPPVNQTSFVGSNATFSVGASGTSLRFQWFFNGNQIGSNAVLNLSNLTTNQAGPYCVVVSGICGPRVTNCANLTILNRAPIANNDSYATPEDTVLTTNAPGVLLNDSDPDADTLTAAVLSKPAHGSVTLNADGSFIYRPNTNYTGPDSFTYRASDTKTNSNIATVSITVTPRNDPPAANNDFYTMFADTVLATNAPGVLLNDTDIENDPLSATLASDPAHGTVTLNQNGSFTYRPNTDYSGTDSFTYRASDGSATSGAATATITIVPNGITIVTPPGNQTNCPGGTAIFSVTATGTALAYQWLFGTNVLAGQTNSTLVLTNVSTADAGVYFVVVDGAAGGPMTLFGNLVIHTNIFVTVPPTNQIVCEGETAQFLIGALGANPSYRWYFGVTLLVGQTTNRLVLTNVSLAAAGVYTVVVTSECGVSVTNSATLTVNQNVTVLAAPTNQVGVVGGSVVFNAVATGTALQYRWYHNGIPLPSTTSTFALDNLTTNRAGAYCVVVSGACGPPVTNCAALIFQNRPPVANNDAYTIDEDTTLAPLAPGVLGNDSDPDGDAPDAALVSNPLHGTVALNADGSFTYRPMTNYHGTDTFTYRASDTRLQSDLAIVTIVIRPMNDTPIAINDDAYTTLEDTPLTVSAPGVLANDIDVDLDPLTAVLVTGPSNGALTLNVNGSFTYRPNTNYFGEDSFTYMANDGKTNSLPALVRITVIPVNDAPSFTGGGDQDCNEASVPRTVPGWVRNMSAGPANESNQVLTFAVSNDNNSLFSVQPSIAVDGTLAYTPSANGFGVANVRVGLRDSGGTVNGGVDTSAEVVFRISVNSPPTVSIISPGPGAGLLYPATFSVIASANDPDGNVTNVQFLVNGSVRTNIGTAPFYFVMSNANVGVYQFSAIVSDNCGLVSTSAMVNVEVITNAVVAKGFATLNRQSGLFDQFVVVSNRTSETWPNGVRLFVHRLQGANRVWNLSGTTNGISYIDILNPVPAGGSIRVIVEYYVPDDRVVPNPELVAVPLPFQRTTAPFQITQIQLSGSTMGVHFMSDSGRFYTIESTEDLLRWTANPTVLRGNGSIIICPEHQTGARRFYRVRMLP